MQSGYKNKKLNNVHVYNGCIKIRKCGLWGISVDNITGNPPQESFITL